MKKIYKILVIEDDPDVRSGIVDILMFSDYEIIQAENGQQGYEKAVSASPDVVLCDINLPDFSGFEVYEKYLSQDDIAHVPFIYLTAYSDREHVRKGMNLGADDYIVKPFTTQELLDSLSTRIRKIERNVAVVESSVLAVKEKVEAELEKLYHDKDEELKVFESKNLELNDALKEKENALLEESMKVVETISTIKNLKSFVEEEQKKGSHNIESVILLNQIKKRISQSSILSKEHTLFQLKFNISYPLFIKNVEDKHGSLSQKESILLSATALGMDTFQISELLHITEDSVRKSRYRLKRKLGLGKEADFYQYVKAFR